MVDIKAPFRSTSDGLGFGGLRDVGWLSAQDFRVQGSGIRV